MQNKTTNQGCKLCDIYQRKILNHQFYGQDVHPTKKMCFCVAWLSVWIFSIRHFMTQINPGRHQQQIDPFYRICPFPLKWQVRNWFIRTLLPISHLCQETFDHQNGEKKKKKKKRDGSCFKQMWFAILSLFATFVLHFWCLSFPLSLCIIPFGA